MLNINNDGSGLIIGLFERETRNPDLSYINSTVWGISMSNSKYQ